MRVVQMLPGPMPIFTASTPAAISARAPSGRRDVAGDHLHRVGGLLDRLHRAQHALRVAMRGVDHDDVRLGGDQRARPGLAVRPDAGCGGDAQAAKFVLVGERVRLGLVHVLDGDQADAAIGVIDHQQLLDPVLVQQAPRSLGADVGGDGDEVLPRHQLIDLQRWDRWRSGRRGW